MRIYEYMIPVYAMLIEEGLWVLTEDTKKDGQEIVPEDYKTPVAKYLAAGIAKRTPSKEERAQMQASHEKFMQSLETEPHE